ncbi:hypothetical protein [Clostridium tagluense]|nr:hypothetical protein [Clostridium tagluense]MBW9154884.1 hypothetical protein [Clostridium tagluense]WLC64339.1 hypothetical protein KTC93_15875 [Clostridium tagluense]
MKITKKIAVAGLGIVIIGGLFVSSAKPIVQKINAPITNVARIDPPTH